MLSRIKRFFSDRMMQIEVVYNDAFVLHAQRLLQRKKTFFL